MSRGSDEYEGAGTPGTSDPDPYEAVLDPDDEADRYDISDAIDPIDQGDPAADEANLYDTSWVPPDREPAHLKWGTTLAEEREGEPLDRRLVEEEPDVFDRLDDDADKEDDDVDDLGEADAEAEPQPRAGRLVAEDEGAHPDEEKDLVARDAGIAGAGASAEEAAVHLVDEPPPPPLRRS
jgi:hypothetical protein